MKRTTKCVCGISVCCRQQQRTGCSGSKGLTLVELLIVVFLLLLLTAATLAVALPALADRRTSEAARTLQAVLITARDRAIATRSVRGIRLVRSTADPWEVDLLLYVGASAPIGGGMVQVQVSGREIEVIPVGSDPHWEHVDRGPDRQENTPDDIPRVDAPLESNPTAYRAGQAYIRFNYGGAFYRILRVNDKRSPSSLILDPATGTPPSMGTDVPYQIFNTVAPLPEAPVPLPDGTVVDVRSEMPVDHPLSVRVNPNNANIDVPRSRNIPNQVPPPAFITNNVPPQQWPSMDILFSPTGSVLGSGAGWSLIYFWVGQRGDKGSPGPDGLYGAYKDEGRVPDDVGPRAPFRLVVLSTRSGEVAVRELGAFTGTRPGFPQIYQYTEDRFDKPTILGQ